MNIDIRSNSIRKNFTYTPNKNKNVYGITERNTSNNTEKKQYSRKKYSERSSKI